MPIFTTSLRPGTGIPSGKHGGIIQVESVKKTDTFITSNDSFVDVTAKDLKSKIGNEKVVLGLSGGVDSSVAALLLHKAIGSNLYCIFWMSKEGGGFCNRRSRSLTLYSLSSLSIAVLLFLYEISRSTEALSLHIADIRKSGN